MYMILKISQFKIRKLHESSIVPYINIYGQTRNIIVLFFVCCILNYYYYYYTISAGYDSQDSVGTATVPGILRIIHYYCPVLFLLLLLLLSRNTRCS